MGEWEQKLSPRARERLAKIRITQDDRERIKAVEKLKFLLSEFYQGKLSPDDFGERLKGYGTEERAFSTKEVQLRLIDSLSLRISSPDFKKRGKCILVLERLKTSEKRTFVKAEINVLGTLIKNFLSEKNQVFEQLKKEAEGNPELMINRVKTNQGEVTVRLSVDEAVLSSAQWRNFISRHDTACRAQFDKSIQQLKELAR